MKTAIITGAGGQVGSYLSELLLENNCIVYGMVRRSSVHNTERIDCLRDNENFNIIEGDVTDPAYINRVVSGIKPDFIFNLAAQSHVLTSFDQPVSTFEADAMGPLYILEAIRCFSPSTRFFQASTSELFGDTCVVSQNEMTALNPVSPYAVAKLCAHKMVQLYRRAYGIFACAGICFNNESPRRGEEFVTRKITKYVAKVIDFVDRNKRNPIVDKDISPLLLGNLDAKRDWSHTKDIVRGIWMMMQQDDTDDFIFGSGVAHSIRDFLELTFSLADVNYEDYVKIDTKYYRPIEVNVLKADYSKAKSKLGWGPTVDLSSLVKEMVYNDLSDLKRCCE